MRIPPTTYKPTMAPTNPRGSRTLHAAGAVPQKKKKSRSGKRKRKTPSTSVQNGIEPHRDVLVRVRSRKRWKTSLVELVSLCSEAQRQRTLRRNSDARTFNAPISKQFTEDTIELMQPLFGWMLRKSADGELKGFLLCTTFTTWVGPQHLRWIEKGKERTLAARLNGTKRHGAPLTTGVVWPRIAEVSLVGGLGCGKVLMHELMRRLKRGDIVSSTDKKPYRYIALQATKNAVGFYERLGFKRVEAEARHFTKIVDGRVIANSVSSKWTPFRHFEYVVPDGLEPSYMMVLPLEQLKISKLLSGDWDVVGEGGETDRRLRESKKTTIDGRPMWFNRHLRAICGENARLAPAVYRAKATNGGNRFRIIQDTGENVRLKKRAAKTRRSTNTLSSYTTGTKKRTTAVSRAAASSMSHRESASGLVGLKKVKMMPKSHRIMVKDREVKQCPHCKRWFHRRGLGPHKKSCTGPQTGDKPTGWAVPPTWSNVVRNGDSKRVNTPTSNGISTNSTTASSWTCPTCTLVNDSGTVQCEVCGASRPGCETEMAG